MSRPDDGSGPDEPVPLPEPIQALGRAVELAHGRLDEEQVAFGRHVVDKASDRLRHGTANTLVALLGATGSGKSSVANALVGDPVATTGVRRPTTSSTLACYWGDDGDVHALLDWLEVKNRHHVGSLAPHRGSNAESSTESSTGSDGDGLDGLVLLDVPDHDSVAVEHRLEMERIAEHADLLLWVTDHEKYADKAMHDYLRRLGQHGAVTAMALNKTDQLDAADVDRCRTDLRRLLADDGLDGAPVIAISATTGQGVDELRAELAAAVTRQRAVVDRLLADTRTAADGLATELGPDGGADDVPDKVAKTLARELVGASGLSAVTHAVEAGHRRDAVARTGWPFTRWVRRLRPHPLRRLHLGQGTGGRSSIPEVSGVQKARTEAAIRNAGSAVTDSLPPPWPDLIRDAAIPEAEVLNDRLDRAISDSVRSQHSGNPRWWTAVNALQIGLAVAAVAGAVWLGLLAFGAYLRLPDFPTPDVRGIPVPTGLLIGGIILGLLVAAVASRLAAVGARRRSRAVGKRAERAVRDISDELVIEPMRVELRRRSELRTLLRTAGAGR